MELATKRYRRKDNEMEEREENRSMLKGVKKDQIRPWWKLKEGRKGEGGEGGSERL